jgi:hypothetical protein
MGMLASLPPPPPPAPLASRQIPLNSVFAAASAMEINANYTRRSFELMISGTAQSFYDDVALVRIVSHAQRATWEAALGTPIRVNASSRVPMPTQPWYLPIETASLNVTRFGGAGVDLAAQLNATHAVGTLRTPSFTGILLNNVTNLGVAGSGLILLRAIRAVLNPTAAANASCPNASATPWDMPGLPFAGDGYIPFTTVSLPGPSIATHAIAAMVSSSTLLRFVNLAITGVSAPASLGRTGGELAGWVDSMAIEEVTGDRRLPGNAPTFTTRDPMVGAFIPMGQGTRTMAAGVRNGGSNDVRAVSTAAEAVAAADPAGADASVLFGISGRTFQLTLNINSARLTELAPVRWWVLAPGLSLALAAAVVAFVGMDHAVLRPLRAQVDAVLQHERQLEEERARAQATAEGRKDFIRCVGCRVAG